MSEAARFIDEALQREASWERANTLNQIGDGLRYYGASVGAVRGTVRDAGRKFRGLTRPDVMLLSAELWSEPVFERRLAAVVLLQSHVALLRHLDLARLERYVREARRETLVDPLAVDVVGPLESRLTGQERARTEAVLDRWASAPDPWLRRAAVLAPLRELRRGSDAGQGHDARIKVAMEHDDDAGVVRGAFDVIAAAQRRAG